MAAGDQAFLNELTWEHEVTEDRNNVVPIAVAPRDDPPQWECELMSVYHAFGADERAIRDA